MAIQVSAALARALTGEQRQPPITEAQWQATVEEAAARLGWLVYHTRYSLRSVAGFPDLTMVKGERLVFAELKSERGKVTADQSRWLGALAATGAKVYVWRPSDWEHVCEVLR